MQQRHVDRMPQFVSQTMVRGLKIHAVHRARGDRIAAPDEQTDGGKILQFEDDSFPQLRIEPGLVAKSHPAPGYYYVVPREGQVEIMGSAEFFSLYIPVGAVKGAGLHAPRPYPPAVEDDESPEKETPHEGDKETVDDEDEGEDEGQGDVPATASP